MIFDAVITAGGRIDGAYARAAGTTIKALAPVPRGGDSMLYRTIVALRGAGARRIAVVGGESVARAVGGMVDDVLPEGATGASNLTRALEAYDGSGEPLVLSASDAPYIDAAAVGDFIARVPTGALAMPLADRDAYVARFPGAPPAGIRLGTTWVVNGDLFVLPLEARAGLARIAGRIFEGRKRPWRMAAVAGVPVLLRWWTGNLRIAHLEARAQRVAGVAATALRACAPELCFDADGLAEYAYACQHP